MEIMVCVGSSCHLHNSREIIGRLKDLIVQNQLDELVELKGSFCMGHCADPGVCVRIGEIVHSVTPENVEEFFQTQVIEAL